MRLNPGAVSILLLVVTLLATGIRIDQKERGCFIQAAAIPGETAPAGGRPGAASPNAKRAPAKGKTTRKSKELK